MGIDKELEITYQMLSMAEYPEDIFGVLRSDDKDGKMEELSGIYRQLAKILHPDRYQNDITSQGIASSGFPLLVRFYERAKKKVEKETYGVAGGEEGDDEPVDLVISTRNRDYHLRSTIAEGDLSLIYSGDFTDQDGITNKIVAKVIKDPSDNDLAQNEIRVLRMLHSNENRYLKHLPKLIDQFKTTEGQMGIILNYLDGYDLYSVRQRYKEGIPEKHMVWMLNRLLSITGYAHSRGVVHCNIEPAHIMIRPDDHNLFLIDWSYAAINPFQTGDGFKIINEDYSAPEVAQRKKPVPASDLYSIGKCMIFLLGGDIKTNTVPVNIDEKIKRLIRYLVLESPLQRAQDAWETHQFLNKLVVELWGPKTFLEFKM
jgi:hypothetical protein